MPVSTSQRSFETLINRFDNGVTLINAWVDYNPSNNEIKKPTLVAMVTTIKNKNITVSNALDTLNTLRDERFLKTFTEKAVNPDCLENRILGIRNYIKGENFPAATLRAIERIIDKIRPKYPKKKDPADKDRPSPSEKSFAAAVGFGRTIIALITNLGLPYTPPDANLTVVNMTALVDDIEQMNGDVQLALDAYGNANRDRRKLYQGKGGLAEVTTKVKGYLSSFSGLKKSNHYIEFTDALKGV